MVSPNSSSSSSNSSVISTPGVAHACLICRPNSHPFNDRTLTLDQAVKVGRSVARARATQTNAIFDCKVLSRNHALLWYEAGKFYLQDTKSSNGTFVNNQRLSKGSEESPPREVCSGDILQFGVDVMENSRKVTHGCIIATLKLYLPDGKEAKASPTIVNSTNNTAMLSMNLQTQDLYQLNQYIQEALAREQLLETKLAVLQRLVGQTETASSDAWKSLIDEDRLLTRVEILEGQLSAYGKSMTEDKMREEVKRLMEDKEEYQIQAKDALKTALNDKMDMVKKCQEVEKALSTTEDENATLKEMYDKNIDETKKLAAKINWLNNELEAAKAKIPQETEENIAANDELEKPSDQEVNEEDEEVKIDNEVTEEQLEDSMINQTVSSSVDDETNEIPAQVEVIHQETIKLDDYEINTSATSEDENEDSVTNLLLNDSLNTSTTTLDLSSTSEVLEDDVIVKEDAENERVESLTEKLNNLENQLQDSAKKITETESSYESLKEVHGATHSELAVAQEQLCEALKLLDEKCRLLEEIEVEKISTAASPAATQTTVDSEDKPSTGIEPVTPDNDNKDLVLEKDAEIAKLTEEKEQICSENERLRADLASSMQLIEDFEQKQMALSSTSTLVGSTIHNTSLNEQKLEKSLLEAESKINELLKVKEKYAEVSAEKSDLVLNLSEMKEEMNLMSLQTKTATACALIPLGIIILAILASYVPFMPNFFGGSHTTDK